MGDLGNSRFEVHSYHIPMQVGEVSWLQYRGARGLCVVVEMLEKSCPLLVSMAEECRTSQWGEESQSLSRSKGCVCAGGVV